MRDGSSSVRLPAVSARLILAAVVATAAFVAYSRTLLPGVDLGDTGAFQAAVLWPRTSARQAYPLYYGLARPLVALVSAGNPARGLNLFSAICGAVAAGALSALVAGIGGSLAGGAAAGLLLAFGYTFWTQAVIAEVYTLHLAVVGISLLALQYYAARPSRRRLALFCAVYALGFGNHLSMILLFVPCAAFVVLAHPRPAELFRPAVIGMALAIAAAGALQYTPNLLALWSSIDAPAGRWHRVASFWFDVTKADWRASMVLGVDTGQSGERVGMWAWDLRQQYGLAGLLAAAIGGMRLWWISRPWAVLVWVGYAIAALFAVTYNVGDSHVFYLPGHFFVALAAGLAFAPRRTAEGAATRWRVSAIAPAASAALLAYAAWRGWETWPAADRHADRRGEALVARTFAGISDQQALFVSQVNWERENGLLYGSRYTQPDVAWVRLDDVVRYLPSLVRDNTGIGRDVVLSADAAATVVAAYGDAFPLVRDDAPPAPRLSEVVDRIPRGAPYVLTVLTPLDAYHHDPQSLSDAVRTLTGAARLPDASAAYEVIAGTAGDRPAVFMASKRPFHLLAALAGEPIAIRMDAWLPTDTFRRGGFGHVLRGREPVLFIERGVSLVWFDRGGAPQTAYASGLYAPEPRYRIPAAATQLAAR